MEKTNATLNQAGALAYRIRNAKLEVLLITSRERGRWIIPKGNIDAGTDPAEAAEKEAYEEAGIKGSIEDLIPLAAYTYSKRLGPRAP